MSREQDFRAERFIRIFLSSTSRDLSEHREAVIRKCAARGYSVVAMEEFGAQNDNASGVSVSEVAQGDVFVGVYARRYGYVPELCRYPRVPSP